MIRSFSASLRGYLLQTLRLLLSIECAHCGVPLRSDPITYFCSRCWESISVSPLVRCTRCDRPFTSPVATTYSPNHLCQACRKHPPAFTRAWTLFPYVPPLQDAICLYKYRGKVDLAIPLARLMITHMPPLSSVDVTIPVPLHERRLREREFNQSLLLADRIASHLKIPLSYSNLVRIISSPAQTTLRRKDRLRNLRGAFGLRQPEMVSGRQILLVDDVFTTGTTVNECAKTLRKAGAGDVFVLTLGRSMETGTVPDRVMKLTVRPNSIPAGI